MTTAIERADLLWNAGRRDEAIQILEEFIPTGIVETSEDAEGRVVYLYKSQTLPAAIEKLKQFHYACAQYPDPSTGLNAPPENRIKHLTRIIELGFRFGHIYKFLAETHHAIGDNERARAYLARAWYVEPKLSGAARISR